VSTISTERIFRMERVEDLSAGTWPRMARGLGVFASAEFLAGLEEDASFDASYLLLGAGEAASPVAALPIYQAVEEDAGAPFHDLRAVFAEPLGLSTDPADWGRSLIGGMRSGFFNVPFLATDLQPPERQTAAVALVEALQRRIDEEGVASAGMLYLTDAGFDLVAPALPGEAVVMCTGANMTITVPPGDFETFLRSLRNPQRNAIIRETRAFEAAEYDVRVTSLREASEWAGPLLCNVDARHGADPDPEGEAERLRAISDRLDDSGRVFVAERDGVPVAASICFAWEDTLHVWGWGCDYDRLLDAGEYFNMAYYRPIAHAAEQGLSGVRVGPEVYRAKASRGGRPTPLYSVLLRAPGLAEVDRARVRDTSAERIDEVVRQLKRVAWTVPRDDWLARVR
jgi:uncharacterized protein